MSSEFDFDDIEIFFTRLGFKAPNLEYGYSKPAIVRAYLSKCSDGTLLDIGDQLGLTNEHAHGHRELGDSKYWLLDHFRVFISHVHTAKQSAANLKFSLQNYGLSAFVAHDDIYVSDEWREEIVKALMSMDAMVAILTKDFSASKWTDQEVGFAVCRDVLVVPLNKGVIPYGFIEKYQASNSNGRTVGAVAEEIFKTICANEKTRTKLIECLTKTILTAPSVELASFRLDKLSGISGVETEAWESIRENIQANEPLRNSAEFVDKLNTILASHKIEPLGDEPNRPAPDDEIPF